MPPDDIDPDGEAGAVLAAEERRRARSAAQGIGTTFAGAALVVASVTGTIAVPLVVATAGVLIAAAGFRRRVRMIDRRLGATDGSAGPADGEPFALVAAALAELRLEAEATDAVLRRIRERGGPRRRAGVSPGT